MISRRIRKGLIVGGTGLFCYFLFCQFYLVTHAMNGIHRSLSGLVLIPAATVSGQSVSYHKVVELAHGVKEFSEVPESSKAFDEALKISVYRLYVEILADELDVRVTNDELEAYPIDIATVGPKLELAKWDERDYRKFILEPLLLAQKTEAAVSLSDEYQAEAFEKMESLRKKLAQGMPFADVAQNFSEDPSALLRGDLGIMSINDVPDWLESSTTLAPGDISSTLHAPNAYWTVTLIEYFSSEVPEQAAVHFRGIAVKKQSFGTVIGNAMQDQPVLVLVW